MLIIKVANDELCVLQTSRYVITELQIFVFWSTVCLCYSLTDHFCLLMPMSVSTAIRLYLSMFVSLVCCLSNLTAHRVCSKLPHALMHFELGYLQNLIILFQLYAYSMSQLRLGWLNQSRRVTENIFQSFSLKQLPDIISSGDMCGL